MTKNICFCGKSFLTLQMRIMHTYANNLLCMCSVITFEKIKLENLVELLRTTDSILVVTSDRRLIEEERLMIEDVFDPYYILVNYLSYKRTHKNRSDEILYYLSNHPCDSYVILDDMDLGYSENEALKPHFINTYKHGFTKDLLLKALELLN